MMTDKSTDKQKAALKLALAAILAAVLIAAAALYFFNEKQRTYGGTFIFAQGRYTYTFASQEEMAAWTFTLNPQKKRL